MDLAFRTNASDRRLGLILTALVHVGLIIGWQAVRTLPTRTDRVADTRRILWLPLAPPRPAPGASDPVREPMREPPTGALSRRLARVPTHPALSLPMPMWMPPAVVPAPLPAPADPAEAPSASGPRQGAAAQILQQARRDIGAIDKALRKENQPYIAAPADSPVIRMRRGMEEAAALAPGRIWEAPKIEDLVNDTGDGARRSRIVTGNGTYCITERAPTTGIDMIEMHGKLRITNCPQHERPASRQEWRTLRD